MTDIETHIDWAIFEIDNLYHHKEINDKKEWLKTILEIMVERILNNGEIPK